jgi:hypothetical protein
MEKKSLFWPLFLIAAGAVWLLIQSGRIPSANLWALTYIWPGLLIAAGVSLILKSFWKYAPMLVDVAVVGGAVLAILYASQLGWTSAPVAWFHFDGDGPFMGRGERGSGNIVTETRDVSDFRAIEVDYPAQVLIKQGKTESVKIEADDNLLPGLRTQVRNDVLEISYKRQNGEYVNPTKAVKITVVVKDLADVEFTSAGELIIEKLKTEALDVSLSGAGNLELNDIQVKTLEVDLSGAGSMTASGTADELDLSITGFGGFNGKELHDQQARVNISGAGSATVWVDDDLNAQISGAGSISYYGSASVRRQISGVGGVNHLGDK